MTSWLSPTQPENQSTQIYYKDKPIPGNNDKLAQYDTAGEPINPDPLQ